MAQTGKAPQSFSEALGDVVMAITNAKMSPDADIGFLQKLELVALARMKHPDQSQPGGAQPTGPAGGGAPPGASGGAPPPGGPAPSPAGQTGAPPQGPPQGGPEPHGRIPQMDPDEMRRVVAQSIGA